MAYLDKNGISSGASNEGSEVFLFKCTQHYFGDRKHFHFRKKSVSLAEREMLWEHEPRLFSFLQGVFETNVLYMYMYMYYSVVWNCLLREL